MYRYNNLDRQFFSEMTTVASYNLFINNIIIMFVAEAVRNCTI
jgi:hypothetical protein